MEYQCISADGHIDLCWLPHDLFTSNATKAMKDRVPFVADTPDGPLWTTKSGLNLGFANGKGSGGALTGGGKYVPGREMRLDRIAATGLYEDGVKGDFRPTTPQLRMKDQDRDGIQAEVLYGLHGTGNKMTDREASVEFYRIYNDWLADFCSYDRKRLVGLASIPSHSVEEAVAESKRVAKLGLGGLDISASWNMVPLWNPYWEPLWQTAAETNMPMHIHTITARPYVNPPDDLPQPFKVASRATFVAASQICMVDILASVLHSGALERHPNLRVVFGESGIGWVPYVLDRLDYEFKGRFRELPLKLKPSEYWRRQCRATFQDDMVGTKLLDDLGVETAMWGSDYPHGDTVFPDSQEYLSRQFDHLPAPMKRKVTCENVGKFYGLM